MSRKKTKRFEYAKEVYYFNINKGYKNSITIKRMDKIKAIQAYNTYLITQPKNCEWLGRWDGKKFIEDDFQKLNDKDIAASRI